MKSLFFGVGNQTRYRYRARTCRFNGYITS